VRSVAKCERTDHACAVAVLRLAQGRPAEALRAARTIPGVTREWEPEDVIACWTPGDEDWRLLGNKSGSTRLGFALLLKFFELHPLSPEKRVATCSFSSRQASRDLSPLTLRRHNWCHDHSRDARHRSQ
jgi:hypothetical protein